MVGPIIVRSEDVTLQRWLDQWRHKPQNVQNRVRVALDFLQKHT
jgi:hypothetical protein